MFTLDKLLEADEVAFLGDKCAVVDGRSHPDTEFHVFWVRRHDKILSTCVEVVGAKLHDGSE